MRFCALQVSLIYVRKAKISQKSLFPQLLFAIDISYYIDKARAYTYVINSR